VREPDAVLEELLELRGHVVRRGEEVHLVFLDILELQELVGVVRVRGRDELLPQVDELLVVAVPALVQHAVQELDPRELLLAEAF